MGWTIESHCLLLGRSTQHAKPIEVPLQPQPLTDADGWIHWVLDPPADCWWRKRHLQVLLQRQTYLVQGR
jgi:hypothetical protein